VRTIQNVQQDDIVEDMGKNVPRIYASLVLSHSFVKGFFFLRNGNHSKKVTRSMQETHKVALSKVFGSQAHYTKGCIELSG
jgi:hypothetical protein